MTRSGYRRYAFSIIGAVAMLTACGGVNGTPLASSPDGLAATGTRANVKYELLYSFSGRRKNGANPYAGLIAVNGTLYGNTGYGGAKGLGTVFAISTSGKETTLNSFSGFDGVLPLADLIDIKGMFYGTTNLGGGRGSCSSSYCGAVFSMTPSGKETVLHSFAGEDGAQPQADFIDVKGTLYSTTLAGGANDVGTVFSIKASGKERVLHSFGGVGDGLYPRAGLINVNGTLYGTTEFGGGGGCGGTGCGTVFSITASGAETVLYSFSGGKDGAQPTAGLIDVNGTLYGTTGYGGGGGCSGVGCGTVFSMTPSGKETVLYRFSGSGDGATPWAALTNVKGTLYGTTTGGGANGLGTVFSITQSGKEIVLYSFIRYGDGTAPFGRLLNVNGTLYGTTAHGGAHSLGTVFSLRP